ncbi:hypothetical protein FACS1894189_2670 [Planctomycetales bacterium]|nr:hypothetical protein FACS1894189_2670 [Planctomycetales bacterium]
MQHQHARQNYLQAEVHTATPQKLQLLLIEAAIKNIHRTKQAWKDEKYDVGFETLAKAQDIVAEILSSLDKDGNPEIAGKLASIYVFIFRCLSESGMTHEEAKLDDALRVLNSERETWRLVCEKFGSTMGADPKSAQSQASLQDTVKLDLSSSGQSAKVLVPPKGSGISTTTFARPGFSQNVKPLGASGIQTDSALSGKPPQPSGGTGKSWDV